MPYKDDPLLMLDDQITELERHWLTPVLIVVYGSAVNQVAYLMSKSNPFDPEDYEQYQARYEWAMEALKPESETQTKLYGFPVVSGDEGGHDKPARIVTHTEPQYVYGKSPIQTMLEGQSPS